ncbi:DUF3891 family protein [Azospirillum picis]|uniref:DUF3891 family protein n=1 Tax=Azospirillum picis TaxID=488438 RepID=A0ABU0MSW5_9PROT|nr:DUF3891 family protein [Azospirillum picis]MBP2302760.1 hypothetical protein [Azospirillum picis]MDQ0536578.1 hypothetical protein [Azospirillum picis]
MLFRQDRQDPDTVIAIPQPSHAWLAGQLLRAWGNDAFDPPSPREEVCLGAELHDIGWLSWEAAPTLNPDTGRPHGFQDLGPEIHTGLWRDGVRRALAFGRYPALLVSLHADTIYTRFYDFDRAEPQEAALVRRFLDEQHHFQQGCLEALADPRHAGFATAETADRNRLFVAAVDWMSLNICWGVREVVPIRDVPAAGGRQAELRLGPVMGEDADGCRSGGIGRDAGEALWLDPWPFAGDRVEVLCEGRRLRGRFEDETAMRQALDSAQSVTITAVLTPRPGGS